ncbi:hypothetical protein ACFQX7_38860 [Luedemannella flava]
MAIASTPSGGSWLAWLAGGKIYLGKLDCDDKLVGKPTTFTGIDLQDVQADANGGVLLLTRKGPAAAARCAAARRARATPCTWSGSTTTARWSGSARSRTCPAAARATTTAPGSSGGTSTTAASPPTAGTGRRTSAWPSPSRTATASTSTRATACRSSARAASWCRTATRSRSAAATRGRRASWDPRAKKFAMVCATDNDCRIAQPSPYRTVASGTCDGTLFGGDLVLAKSKGYWTAWSQGGKIRLEHFTTGASDKRVSTGFSSRHPHLVTYGSGRMLLSWASGSGMTAQVYDSGTGAKVGGTFTINARDHDYQAFKAYLDGSAAYLAAGSNGTSIRIARVMPLG